MSDESKYNRPYTELSPVQQHDLLNWINRKVKYDRVPKKITREQERENMRKVEARHNIEEHQARLAERDSGIFEGIEL